MTELKYVVFDFDGTIADTLDLALKLYNKVAHEYNCKPVSQTDREIIRSGKPQELLKAYGVSRIKLFSIMLRMRKELSKHIAETELINDIETSLYEIKNAGYKLGILTSNSRENVRKFLERNSLSDIIDFIYSGNSLFGKDKVIRRMLNRENIAGQSIVYIGDETRDVEACKRAGIPVMAVSWGLSSREALASMLPDQIADEPKELVSCVERIFKQY